MSDFVKELDSHPQDKRIIKPSPVLPCNDKVNIVVKTCDLSQNKIKLIIVYNKGNIVDKEIVSIEFDIPDADNIDIDNLIVTTPELTNFKIIYQLLLEKYDVLDIETLPINGDLSSLIDYLNKLEVGDYANLQTKIKPSADTNKSSIVKQLGKYAKTVKEKASAMAKKASDMATKVEGQTISMETKINKPAKTLGEKMYERFKQRERNNETTFSERSKKITKKMYEGYKGVNQTLKKVNPFSRKQAPVIPVTIGGRKSRTKKILRGKRRKQRTFKHPHI